MGVFRAYTRESFYIAGLDDPFPLKQQTDHYKTAVESIKKSAEIIQTRIGTNQRVKKIKS